jgi:hypothetical protein
MENLPFLQPKEDAPPLRNVQSPENEWPDRERQMPAYMYTGPPDISVKPDFFEQFKGNPVALILLGIVIGVLLTNMRPLVIQPK